MTSTPHLKSADYDLFDDDFAEASIEALSFAAMRNVSSSRSPHSTDEQSFPRPSPSLPSRTHALRRALSSLSGAPLPSPRRPAPPRTTSESESARAFRSFGSARSLNFEPPGNLALSPHPHVWYTDVLVLPHNALRAELADLCAMLASLAKPAPHVLHRMRAVADWWPAFDAFLGDYFAFEKQVLLPWIYRGSAATDLQDLRHKMAGHAAYINDLVLEVHNVLALFNGSPEADVLPLLIRTAREFVPSLLQYLDVEERYLPSVIHAGHMEGDAFNLTRLMTRKLDPVLLTRWIPARKDRTAIRRMYMTPAACFRYFAKRRKAYVSHLDLVELVCGTLAVP